MQQQRVQVETIPLQQVSIQELENCVKANVEGSNNALRTKAEKFLKDLRHNQPIEYIRGLAQLLAQSKNQSVRCFSAVLLRQAMGVLDFTFDKVPQGTQNELKQLLLNLTENETNRNVLLQVTQVLGALACKKLHSGGWPQLMDFMAKLSKSSQARHREAFLAILEQLCEFAVDVLRPNLEQTKGMLMGALKDENEHVRIAAIKSCVKLLLSLEETQELSQFKEIVPLLFQNISVATKAVSDAAQQQQQKGPNNNNEMIEVLNQVICDACSQLHGLTTNIPDFFADTMKPIVQCLAEVVNTSRLQWETRRLAMDLLRTLVECNIHVFEENEKDFADLSNKLIPLCFLFIHEVDESLLESNWSEPNDLVEQVNFIFGCEMLHAVANILDAQMFWDLCYENVLTRGFQPNSSWRDRVTALATIEKCVEPCLDLFVTDSAGAAACAAAASGGNETDEKSEEGEELLDERIDEQKLQPIVQAVGQSLTHANPFVRYQALLVLKQLSVVFGHYGFQTAYHSCVMNALNEMIADKANQQHRCVKIQVCDTLAHFCYELEPHLMQKHADITLKGLHSLLEVSDVLIQCEALKAVSVLTAIVADGDDSRFNKYYNIFMSLCKKILSSTLSDKDRFLSCESAQLRSNAMQCIGTMFISMCCPDDGTWLQNDVCTRDAHELMKVLLPFHARERAAGLESYTYLNALFASIAAAIRHEFKPYLKDAITPLLDACKLEPVRIQAVAPSGLTLDSDAAGTAGTAGTDENEDLNASNGLQAKNGTNGNQKGLVLAHMFHVHGEQSHRKVELHTGEAAEQYGAVKQLLRYAENMGTELFEFVEPITHALIAIMRRRGNSSMRRTATSAVPHLVRIMRDGLVQQQQQQQMQQMQQNMNSILSRMLNASVRGLISAMVIEEDVYGLTEITQDLIDTLEFVDPSQGIGLDEDVVGEIVEQVGNAVAERMMRRAGDDADDVENLSANVSGSNSDAGASAGSTGSTGSAEVDDKGVEEAEAELGNKVCDLVARVTSLFGADLVRLFDETACKACLELFKNKITNEADWIFGLGIFAELIRHGGREGSKYVAEVLSKCAHLLASERAMRKVPNAAQLKQSIGYVVGVCAQQREFHNNLNPQWWGNELKRVIIDEATPMDSNDLSRDNAVSAIGKIMDRYWGEMVMTQDGKIKMEMVAAWVEMLPIREDDEEREFCNAFLVRLMQKRGVDGLVLDVLLKQLGSKMVGKLVEIVGNAQMSSEDGRIEDGMKAMMQHVKQCCGDQVMTQTVAKMDPKLQMVFGQL